MNPEQEKTIRTALHGARAVDADIIGLPEFATIIAKVETEADAALAVAQMRKMRPALFHELDFSKMTSRQFDKAEENFRANLRKPGAFSSTPFHNLDAGRLDDEELKALDHCVAGESNSWDRGLLTRAAARQKHEDRALNGDDAA
jgi:hypothetical protein